MLERASELPMGKRMALVMTDGCVILFGKELAGKARTFVLHLQRHLFRRGIEPTALAFSDDGSRWAFVGSMPNPGSKRQEIEEQLDKLLLNYRSKSTRRRRRRHGGARKSPRQEPHGRGRADATT